MAEVGGARQNHVIPHCESALSSWCLRRERWEIDLREQFLGRGEKAVQAEMVLVVVRYYQAALISNYGECFDLPWNKMMTTRVLRTTVNEYRFMAVVSQ